MDACAPWGPVSKGHMDAYDPSAPEALGQRDRGRLDRIDEAAPVVGSAVSPLAQIRSQRLVQELRTTRARMQPWRNTPAVKALGEQLATHGLASSSAT